MIEMYASDLTHKKRAAAIYRSLQLQKEWFASGETIRILRQKGGNDYSYMTELQQGCIQDECWKNALGVQMKSGSGPMTFDPATMTNVTIIPDEPFEFGDIVFEPINGILTPMPTLDDGTFQIPMNGNDFYMFGYNAGAAETIVWNTNNAIFFGPPTSVVDASGNSLVNWKSLISFGPTDGYRDTNSAAGNGFVPVIGKYMLLGNYDRRLTNFYTTQYRTEDTKYYISKFVAVFDDYYNYEQVGGQVVKPDDTPPQGIFSVRLIRELVGQNRQWVEVSVIKSPPSPGYIADTSRTYPSGNYYTAKDANGIPITPAPIYNGRPVDPNGNLIDPTKISPYDICDGTTLINICGTTFSDVSPATGTSFIFQSNSLGQNWAFRNNSYLPI